MKALISKELTSIFCSTAGLVFSFVYLIACGSMLWIFPGNLNILDAGYSTLNNFFSISPVLFTVLIPALTMRLIAEERRNKTFALLLSRPVTISQLWFSKWISAFAFVFLVILSTTVYIYSIYALGNPVGNIDMNATLISYLSLIFLAGIFICVGLFASSLTENQIAAFIIALLLNFTVYYGFDLLSTLFQDGKMRSVVVSCGLSSHFGQLQRGVVQIDNIIILVLYFTLFRLLSLLFLSQNKKSIRKNIATGSIITVVSVIVLLLSPNLQFDFTTDKRFTINDYSKELIKSYARENTSPLKVNVYLEGNLNFGFQRLRDATKQLLSELDKYADYKLDVSFINPASLPIERDNLPEHMTRLGMTGIMLNEVGRDGKLSRQIIYPYAQIVSESDTLQISLLKNIPGNTAEENLNASIENLEFQFIDAIHILTQTSEQHIAFVEGHGELSRADLYDAEEILSKYFFINRGQIINDISVLDDFKVVIIAGPTQKFTEAQKYILDQYLMKGGRIFWLIDGAYLSLDNLASEGQSPSMKNETGLDDMLFTYGIRIEPNLIQDSQSAQIVVKSDDAAQPVAIPWHYSPLLLPSPEHPVTKDISPVKAQFVSSISLLNTPDVSGEVLLTTSQHSRIVQVPEMINFDIEKIQDNPRYFNDSYIPAATTLEGRFRSPFENRMIPDSIRLSGHKTISTGEPTKMIVAASSDIIRNEIVGQGNQVQVLPMGFDPVTGRQYGNRDFIVNAVKWLADDPSLLLRTKSRQLNLLNKQLIYENRNLYASVNTAVPVLLILLMTSIVNLRRRIKYNR